MLKWKFNHFPNFEQLSTYASDVFVGNALRLTHVFLINGFIFNDDFSISSHLNNSFWNGPQYGKWQGFSE